MQCVARIVVTWACGSLEFRTFLWLTRCSRTGVAADLQPVKGGRYYSSRLLGHAWHLSGICPGHPRHIPGWIPGQGPFQRAGGRGVKRVERQKVWLGRR